MVVLALLVLMFVCFGLIIINSELKRQRDHFKDQYCKEYRINRENVETIRLLDLALSECMSKENDNSPCQE